MQLNNLKKNKSNRKAKQVGRGGARGKTSGRGTKGQNARAGRKKRPEMRDIIKRLPKLRGRGKNFLKSRLEENTVVKFSALVEAFKVGETVSPKVLLEKGLVKIRNGKIPKIKILADNQVKKSFIFEGVKVSENVKKLVV
ncbi:MAG: uL15 family ribosomal protein [Candidatus Paceibacterota bacterium]|jgi:large subunit ribosomal protein L15